MDKGYERLVIDAYQKASGKNALGRFLLPWRERFPGSLASLIPLYNPRLLAVFDSDAAPHLVVHGRFDVELRLPYRSEPGRPGGLVPWVSVMSERTALYRAALLSLLTSWPPTEMLSLEAALQPNPQE